MRMKNAKNPIILLAGPLPPPPGGIATAVSTLLRSSLVEDFKFVHLMTSTTRPASKKGKIDMLNIAAFIFQLSSLVAKIMYYRPNIIQIESASGISFFKNSFFVLISKMTFRKVILSVHTEGSRLIELSRNLPPIGKRFLKLVLSKCDVVRILSERWMSAFASEFDLEESKIYVIPNAVRIEDFNNGTSFKNRPGNEVTLLFLGWVGAKKGVFDLLDSSEVLASKGYQFKLLIVGPEMKEGDADKVRRAVINKHLEKQVRVVGEKERSEALKFYYAADIYVLPSYTEGLPLGILEAMAAGLPVIATTVGSIPEVVEEGVNGFLINPGDVMDLASKIEALMNNRALMEEMGANNRAKVQEKYSLAKHIEMFNNLYLRLVGVR